MAVDAPPAPAAAEQQQNGGAAAAAKASMARVTSAVVEPEPPLTVDNINPHVTAAQYAVRGAIVTHAKTLEQELALGEKLPFDSLVWCNIGNPQQLGQKPITFFRQVLALCDYPELIDHPLAGQLFPADALARAKAILAGLGTGGTGAYSDSRGALCLREDVCKGIERRDGFPAYPDEIFMSDGASQSVHMLLRVLLRDRMDAVLTPIPQYPLYSAGIELYGGTLLPYYLNEDDGWALDTRALRRAVAGAQADGYHVRALVIINPGNPTGQVLSVQNQKDIVALCAELGLLLIADEVYQDNVYAADKKFVSFKKIVRMMGDAGANCMLASLHSVSKGVVGECGRRGGYAEIINVANPVGAEIAKLASINLCSNLPGQVCMALQMNPPQPGEPSHEQYAAERAATLASLGQRAARIAAALEALDGVTCAPPEGALYLMPRVRLPAAAVQEAQELGVAPDLLYCKALLDATGVVTVPGSGFKQVEGTYHFRTTFLPPPADVEVVCERITRFHQEFLAKYGAPSA